MGSRSGISVYMRERERGFNVVRYSLLVARKVVFIDHLLSEVKQTVVMLRLLHQIK